MKRFALENMKLPHELWKSKFYYSINRKKHYNYDLLLDFTLRSFFCIVPNYSIS